MGHLLTYLSKLLTDTLATSKFMQPVGLQFAPTCLSSVNQLVCYESGVNEVVATSAGEQVHGATGATVVQSLTAQKGL